MFIRYARPSDGDGRAGAGRVPEWRAFTAGGVSAGSAALDVDSRLEHAGPGVVAGRADLAAVQREIGPVDGGDEHAGLFAQRFGQDRLVGSGSRGVGS